MCIQIFSLFYLCINVKGQLGLNKAMTERKENQTLTFLTLEWREVLYSNTLLV